MNNTKYTLFPNQVTRLMAAFLSGVMTSEQRARIRALLGAADAATDLTTPDSTASTYALRYAATPTHSKEFIAAFLRGDMTSRQQRDFCAYIDTTFAGAISTDTQSSLYGRERALFPIQIKKVIARFLAGSVTEDDQVILRTLCCFDAATTAPASAAPEASYVAALRAAGATVTPTQQAALSSFISGEIAAGRWGNHKRIHFPVWQLAAANAICMKSLTSGTFFGGFIHHNYGVQNYGQFGSYFNTAGQFLTPLGITKSSYHISYMETRPLSDVPDSGVYIQSLTSPSGSPVIIQWVVGKSYDDDNLVVEVSSAFNFFDFNFNMIHEQSGVTIEPMGVVSISGNGSAQYGKIRNVLGVSTKATGSIVQSGNSPAALDLSFAGSQYSEGSVSCSFLSLGTYMTTEQDSLFTAAVKTLWENVTGLSFPTP
jgi:hypothetical protein